VQGGEQIWDSLGACAAVLRDACTLPGVVRYAPVPTPNERSSILHCSPVRIEPLRARLRSLVDLQTTGEGHCG